MSSAGSEYRREHEDHSYQIYTCVGIAGFLQSFTTALRLIIKLRRKLKVSWDDYLILLGTCLNITADAFDVTAAVNGFGRHSEFLSFEQIVQAQKYAQLAVIVAIFAKCAIKLSICCFLLNMIQRTHQHFTIAIKALMCFTAATYFICAILWGLQAKPITALWDPRVKGYRESDQRFIDTLYVIYAFGVITDLFYSLSPVYFLWNVRIKISTKITILALTGSGLLVTVTALLDIVFAREFLSAEDATWVLTNEFICDILERNIGCFIANLPVLRSVLLHHGRKPISSPHGNSSDHSYTRQDGENLSKNRLRERSYDIADRSLVDTRVPEPVYSVTVGKTSPSPKTDLFDARGSDDGIPLRDLRGTTENMRIEVQHEFTVQTDSMNQTRENEQQTLSCS